MSAQTKQKKAAREIAAIMYASLQQFPQEEQQKRLEQIQKIAGKSSRKPSGKSSKLSSTRGIRPSRRRASTAR
jgi:hypothetical protein